MIATTTPTIVIFDVLGKPQPAGSKRAFPIKRANGSTGVAVSDANPKARDWKQAVATACRDSYGGPLLIGPLRLVIDFRMPRPASHFGSGRKSDTLKPSSPEYHTQKPDTTKLLRAVEDGLNSVLWRDDSQVVSQTVTKRWCSPGEAAGASVTVIEIQ